MRRDWMFKLVGTETFNLGQGNAVCTIRIDAVGGFNYQYTLEVKLNFHCLISLHYFVCSF